MSYNLLYISKETTNIIDSINKRMAQHRAEFNIQWCEIGKLRVESFKSPLQVRSFISLSEDRLIRSVTGGILYCKPCSSVHQRGFTATNRLFPTQRIAGRKGCSEFKRISNKIGRLEGKKMHQQIQPHSPTVRNSRLHFQSPSWLSVKTRSSWHPQWAV